MGIDKKCLTCDVDLLGKRESSIYCSLKCKALAYQQQTPVACAACKKVLMRPTRMVSLRKNFFCNRTCRGIYERKCTTVICSLCKNEIKRMPARIRQNKGGRFFCNNNHRVLWLKANATKRIILICYFCEREIRRRPSRVRPNKTSLVFCNRQCQRLWLPTNNAGRMVYNPEFLRWLMEQDCHTCHYLNCDESKATPGKKNRFGCCAYHAELIYSALFYQQKARKKILIGHSINTQQERREELWH